MKCAEFLEEVGAYALGALAPEDATRMEHHLAESSSHEGCEEALVRARRVVAALAYAIDPLVASDRLWRRIAERAFAAGAGLQQRPPPAVLAATQPGTRRPAAGGPPGSPRIKRREVVAWSLAAAASVAAMLGYRERARFENEAAHLRERAIGSEQKLTEIRTEQTAERERCRLELERIHHDDQSSRDLLALLDRPATRIVRLEPAAGKSRGASAIVNVDEGRYVIVAADMQKAEDKDLELWIIRGSNAPIPAGFLRPGTDNVATGEIDRTAASRGPIDALAVSLEPLGGSPSPTEVLMVGKLHG
jgi:anti-sigma-K factor RskA